MPAAVHHGRHLGQTRASICAAFGSLGYQITGDADVDDAPNVTVVLARSLHRLGEGYTIDTAHSGPRALEKLAASLLLSSNIDNPAAASPLQIANLTFNDGAIPLQTHDEVFTVSMVHDVSGAVQF